MIYNLIYVIGLIIVFLVLTYLTSVVAMVVHALTASTRRLPSSLVPVIPASLHASTTFKYNSLQSSVGLSIHLFIGRSLLSPCTLPNRAMYGSLYVAILFT